MSEKRVVTIELSNGMATWLEGYALLMNLPSIEAAIINIVEKSPVPRIRTPQQAPQDHTADKD